MTRQEWMELARLIADRRAEIVRMHGKPSEAGAYERQLIRAAQLASLDDTARALCRWLAGRSSRFQGERFIAMAGVRPG